MDLVCGRTSWLSEQRQECRPTSLCATAGAWSMDDGITSSSSLMRPALGDLDIGA